VGRWEGRYGWRAFCATPFRYYCILRASVLTHAGARGPVRRPRALYGGGRVQWLASTNQELYAERVIALIDYGSGNLRSVHKALLKVGASVRIVRQPEEIEGASAVVLPGVGAFDDCIQALEKQALLQASRQFIRSGRPFLGICVGYQALFEKSEEFNSCAAGLGVFQGNVVRFQAANGLKIPQIGWNQLDIVLPDCPIFKGIPSGSYVYFVHSFFPKPADASIVATRTMYGEPFASSVWRDNVFATQFHPEKSQKLGLQLLSNFVALAKS
jgi:imidazole glycerol-phosphate synthase subunit HisH